MTGTETVGVGILGNCCTHGAGLAAALGARDDVRVVTGFEPDRQRGEELRQAMQAPLAASYAEVAGHSDVAIVVVTCDPCDKPDMVELAAEEGKHVLLNKPFAHSLDGARRIAAAVERSGIKLVHDIPMVRSWPVYAWLKDQTQSGAWGRPISYNHCFGMSFAEDFPIVEVWPERFDPPEVSGGGEMTNMGCYAIDYAVTLLGSPRSVQARMMAFWDAYSRAGVENFGQIALDYGDLYALLSVGKQQLREPRQHTNWLSVQFPHKNVFVEPHNGCLLVDGVRRDVGEYLGEFVPEGSFDELLRCIATDAAPDSDAATGVRAVEVLMAAYRSALGDGAPVALPLSGGENPLVGPR